MAGIHPPVLLCMHKEALWECYLENNFLDEIPACLDSSIVMTPVISGVSALSCRGETKVR